MGRIPILTALVVTAACSVSAQQVTGDWQGTLSAGGSQLRLKLHISKSTDGALEAVLDSIDQGANGIPVSSISVQDGKLNLGVDAVHGTYEGKVAADGNTITGTWSQGQPLPLDFRRAAEPVKPVHKPARPSDIEGAWMGLLDTGAVKLRVVFHILNTEDGLMATMDSPDQGMKAMPATSVRRDGASLKVEAKSIGGVFEGRIAADRSSIDGTWTQGGGKLRLVLKPVKDQSEMERRPLQKPTKACRIREEDASCPNPQGRDESLPGHQPFVPRWGSQAVRVETHPGQVFLARNHAERMVRDRDAIRKMPREENFERRAGS
jgi:hypothetical protein